MKNIKTKIRKRKPRDRIYDHLVGKIGWCDGEQYWVFKNSQLENVRTGNVLPIPKRQLKSKHYSGINHNTIEVSLNKLHYKEPNDRTIFPNRYKKLIHRK